MLASAPIRPFEPTERLSDHSYKILRLLGHGSYGSVYLACYYGPEHFTRQVALKVLREDLDLPAEMPQQMRDEARILGLVRHRAIVGVDRPVRLAGRKAIVMEYVEGASLDLLASAVRIRVQHVLEIVAEVASGLHVGFETHGPDGAPLGLLHRDIKPSNVLVTLNGEVKVLDFGVAKASFLSREAETRHLAFGSPGYVAPERYQQRELPAGDVYSLGVVFWELLARERMGRCGVRPQRHGERLEQALEHLCQRQPNLPDGVVNLLSDMLAYEPEDRPTAREVWRRSHQIARTLQDEPLAFWAQAAVKPLLGRDAGIDQLGWCGMEFAEGSGPTGPARIEPVDGEGCVGFLEELPTVLASRGTDSEDTPQPAPGRPTPRRAPSHGAVWSVTALLGLATMGVGATLIWFLLALAKDAPEGAPSAEDAPEVASSPIPASATFEDGTYAGVIEGPPDAPQELKATDVSNLGSPPTRSSARMKVDIVPPTCAEGQIFALASPRSPRVVLERAGRRSRLPTCLDDAGLYSVYVESSGGRRRATSVTVPDQRQVQIDCVESTCDIELSL